MLGLEQTLTEQAAATDEILAKQFRHDKLDVGCVDLVDETVDGFLQGVPGHPLIFFAALVGDGSLKGAQLMRGHIHALAAQVEQLLVLGPRVGELFLLRLGRGFWRRRALLLGWSVSVGIAARASRRRLSSW
jgi:hypothetical protein